MPQVHPCEECGKIIDESDKFVIVNVESSNPNVLAQQKGRVHAKDCWEKYSKKHPDSASRN